MAIFIPFFLVILFTLTTQPTHAELKSSSATLAYTNMVEQDSRGKVLFEFLALYDSPLAPYSQKFVDEADRHNIDWKLLVAISGVESTFGHDIPYNSYNAWGWGIYGSNVIYFASYDQAIETISKALRENYINPLGTDSVYQIGSLYAASPTWAQRVISLMNRIENEYLKITPQDLSLTI